jgi:TetR/AcrR family transcriptional repressor of nem operon
MKTRDRIIDAADRLFYEQGYEVTSFADIAEDVGLSRGNFYYHFKTKDEILDAVIDYRLKKTKEMVERWQIDGQSPRDRIGCYINIMVQNRAKIVKYGCPVGTLCAELFKLGHSSRKHAADIFTCFRNWLVGHFNDLGFGAASDQCAMHVLTASQGIATMAQAFNDSNYLEEQVKGLHAWLDQEIEQKTNGKA